MVTGARKGLGRGIAEGLAEAGADIVGVGPIPMPETEKAVRALGRKFLFMDGDPGAKERILDIIPETVAAMGSNREQRGDHPAGRCSSSRRRTGTT